MELDQNLHNVIMAELQDEWEENRITHKKSKRINREGIRSSQISALVALLIKKGIITEEA